MARDAAQIIREARGREQPQAQKQDGAEKLRETISRRDYKPGPNMPGLGSVAQGKLQTPSSPRLGDANIGQAAVTKMREQREGQEQKLRQEQRQQR